MGDVEVGGETGQGVEGVPTQSAGQGLDLTTSRDFLMKNLNSLESSSSP